VEAEWIARESERGPIANVQNVPKAKPGPAAPRATRRMSKAHAHHDEAKHRFEVRCRKAAIAKDDQVKRFAYNAEVSQEAAAAAAEAWAEEMQSKCF
jgi:hypothetical protein